MTFGESSGDWLKVLGAVVVVVLLGALAIFILSPAQASSAQTPTPTPVLFINLEPTPQPTPHHVFTPPPRSPTPIRTPTPQPTPSPSPTPIRRWCDAEGCHEGIAPTPTPIPTPTPLPTPSPTPIPEWVKAGMKCVVPDALLGERWVVAYQHDCTCVIQKDYQLGSYFSPFEGCQSNSAWRDKSCACVNEICAASSGLC